MVHQDITNHTITKAIFLNNHRTVEDLLHHNNFLPIMVIWVGTMDSNNHLRMVGTMLQVGVQVKPPTNLIIWECIVKGDHLQAGWEALTEHLEDIEADLQTNLLPDNGHRLNLKNHHLEKVEKENVHRRDTGDSSSSNNNNNGHNINGGLAVVVQEADLHLCGKEDRLNRDLLLLIYRNICKAHQNCGLVAGMG